MNESFEFGPSSSFRKLKKELRAGSRYRPSAETGRFLSDLIRSAEGRRYELPEGRHLWRAQLGAQDLPTPNDEFFVPFPFPPMRMKPLVGKAKEGRANYKGVPALYLATSKATAIAEVRPFVGSRVSVAVFSLDRDLFVVNCKSPELMPSYREDSDSEERERTVWWEIDCAFGRPIVPTEDTADYLPTQIIAEEIRNAGYDGLLYRSALSTGDNLVLFDTTAASIQSCTAVEVSGISISIVERGGTYIMRPEAK